MANLNNGNKQRKNATILCCSFCPSLTEMSHNSSIAAKQVFTVTLLVQTTTGIIFRKIKKLDYPFIPKFFRLEK